MNESILMREVYQEFARSINAAKLSLALGEDADQVIRTLYRKGVNAFVVLVTQINKDADFPELTKKNLAQALSDLTGESYRAGNARDELLSMFPSLRGEGDAA